MVTFQKLRLFVAVYERGSFNRAADLLYTTQSAVSQNIHTLEADLGARLFDRSPAGVTPTPAGDTLYEYARRLLALLAEAEHAIMQVDQVADRQLTVAATPGVSVYLLPPWLHAFQSAYPNISVSLQTALTSEVVTDTLSGRYALGFLEGELAELDHPNLGKLRLRDIAYQVVVHPTHVWANAGSVSVAQLVGQPFINRLPTSRARRWLESLLGTRGIRLRTTAELDSPGAIKYAVLNEMGVSILPRYAVEREGERGDLRLLSLLEVELTRPLLLIYDRRQPLTPILRAFIRVALESDGHELIL